jgi:hypothetical protein
MFRLNRNLQKTHPNSLKESIFVYVSENVGLFWFVTKQFCLFRLFRYRFETPKQTRFLFFDFTKQTETNPKQILFRFEPKFIFVCFEDTQPGLSAAAPQPLGLHRTSSAGIQLPPQAVGCNILN